MKLYKAYSSLQNIWVEGYYVYVEGLNTHYIIIVDKDNLDLRDIEWIQVDGETVSLWTGLVDMEGIKIFENDLYVPPYYGGGQMIGLDDDNKGYIEYDHGSFIVKPRYEKEFLLSSQIKKEFFEYRSNVGEIYKYKDNICLGMVIGNKFEE